MNEETSPSESNQEQNPEQQTDNSQSLDNLEENGDSLPIEFLNNVPLKLSVELGMGGITIRELMQLGHGAVFELDKLAGEPLEVKVNDRLISRGEVVVVNDRYAIRLTDVINPEEINK